MKAVAQKATQVKDALNVDELIHQAKEQVKRQQQNFKERRKDRNRDRR